MATNLDRVATRHKHLAVAMFNTQAELVTALRELHRLGFSNDQISVLAKDSTALAECIRVEGAKEGVPVDGPDALAYESEPKGRPEVMGMAIGGAVGVILGLSAVALPGFGSFLLAAGPIAVIMHGLTVGAAGLGLGALLGAIMDEKVTEEHRDYYVQELEAGHWMMVVHGNETDMERAQASLQSHTPTRLDVF